MGKKRTHTYLDNIITKLTSVILDRPPYLTSTVVWAAFFPLCFHEFSEFRGSVPKAITPFLRRLPSNADRGGICGSVEIPSWFSKNHPEFWDNLVFWQEFSQEKLKSPLLRRLSSNADGGGIYGSVVLNF